MMFDCGMPYNKMEEDLFKVDSLLITHAHTDHVNPKTFEKIRKNFPTIKVYANADVAYRYQVDVIVGTRKIELPRKRVIIPYEGRHDIPVTYYIVKTKDINFLYATDTNIISNPDEIPLDYVFLESNYDEKKLKALSEMYKRKGYDPYTSSLRHLSIQKCKAFYFINRRNNESELIELHKSHRFY